MGTARIEERGGVVRRVVVAGAALLAAAALGAAGAIAVGGVGLGRAPEPTPAARAYAAASGVVTVRPVEGDLQGSGFVADAQGHVVTNAHVLGDAQEATIAAPGGPERTARVVLRQSSADLVVLRIEDVSGGLPDGLTPLELADDASVQVGETAVAVGSPFGLSRTVTQGIVSGLNRALPTGEGVVGDVIQTDASVNPGNSGGPLLDADGRVIGVTTAISTRTGADEGVAFAIPARTVARVLEQARSGADGLPWLGFVGQDTGPGTLAGGDRPAVLVESVRDEGPSAAAGLRPGDLITGVDEEPVRGNPELAARIGRRDVGEEVVLRVVRGGAETDVVVTLGARPAG